MGAATAEAASASRTYTAAALADQVTHLPGLADEDQPKFRHFSGHLTVDADSGRALHYWFVEAAVNASTAPVIWWSNGGPTCSGLLGLLLEHGPWRPQAAPATGLVLFDFSWNRVANVLYMEVPAGVGFSYSNTSSGLRTGDTQTAADNLVGIERFFERFPELRRNDLYISAESYGGVYVPMLAQLLVQSGVAKDTFRGFLLGNPVPVDWGYGRSRTWCGRALASKPACDTFFRACLLANASHSSDPAVLQACRLAEEDVASGTGGMDPYGLDFPYAASDTCAVQQQARTLQRYMRTQPAQDGESLGLARPFPGAGGDEPPFDVCVQDEVAAYLRREDVRAALHVPSFVGKWQACGGVQPLIYNRDNEQTSPEMYQWLLTNAPHLRMLVYSGDDDSNCPTLVTEALLFDAVFNGTAVQPVGDWAPWDAIPAANTTHGIAHERGGFSTLLTKQLAFATVHSAGHMVSYYQPRKGFALLDYFLQGRFHQAGLDNQS